MIPIKVIFTGKDIIIFKNLEKYFFYDSTTGLISESNTLINDILIQLENKYSLDDIYINLSGKYDHEILNRAFAQIDNALKNGNLLNGESKPVIRSKVFTEEEWDKSIVLENLQLNISHTCNMQCIYCYADHGKFNSIPKIMTKETAKSAIEFWFRYIDKSLKKVNVVFLGGEPLINKEVLKYALEYITKLASKYSIKVGFSLTSNGTLIDEDILEYISRYGIQVDISIDGGKFIQNKNRKMLGQAKSFGMISDNVIMLRKHYRRLVAKVTLIQEDVKNLEKSVKDLWEIGFTDILYNFVLSEDPYLSINEDNLDELKKEIFKIADLTYKNIVNNREGKLINLMDIGYRIHNNDVRNECSLLNPFTIQVTPEGDIYKCGKLVGNNSFCVGNIYSGVNWNKFSAVIKKYPMETECSNCWAKRICGSGCAYSNILYTKDVNMPNRLLCEERKIQIIGALYLYTKLLVMNPIYFDKTYNKLNRELCM